MPLRRGVGDTTALSAEVSPLIQYYLVKQSLPWLEAMAYCRTQYTDLVTTMSDLELFAVAILGGSNEFWIGFYLCNPGDWNWSNGATVSYTKWNSGEPSLSENACALINSQKWSSSDCGATHYFMCYKCQLHVVEIAMTWSDSRKYCRSYFTDLAAILSLKDQINMADLLSSRIVSSGGFWFGLRRNRFWGNWYWSGGQQWGTFSNWGDKQPDNPISKPCTLISGNPLQNFTWSTDCCVVQRPFVCSGPSGGLL
ncbi:putative C-type lectin domain family 20 member A [Hyperolius riggenbachi]|uniref:putative C-type lectin domain family 20 member A n=1 Tax=Hyperolius riggenbachi TaxID=752182 RepID=UPI0035A34520